MLLRRTVGLIELDRRLQLAEGLVGGAEIVVSGSSVHGPSGVTSSVRRKKYSIAAG